MGRALILAGLAAAAAEAAERPSVQRGRFIHMAEARAEARAEAGAELGTKAAPNRNADIAAPEPAAVDYAPLATGSLGGFPYYWRDPATLRLTRRAYDWINSAVNGAAAPAQLCDVFTNVFAAALGSISYGLSPAERDRLAAARALVQQEQAALLEAWAAAFGPSWTGRPGAPIDAVIGAVAAGWGDAPLTLEGLVAAPDPVALLPRAPAGAAPVLPALVRYLAAVAAVGGLIAPCSRQGGSLSRALTALRAPSADNGGVVLDDGTVAPGWTVATPVSAILAGLAADGAGFDTRLLSTAGGSRVAADGVATTVRDPARLVSLGAGDGAELAGAALAAAAQPVAIGARFEGVTPVLFGPAPFDAEAATGWYWDEPLIAAMRAAPNSGGFGFSPRPPYDFSPAGRFGRLAGVLIARAPALSLTLERPAADRLADVVNNDPGATLGFLGQTVSAPDTAENVCATVSDAGGGAAPTLRIAPSITAPSTASRAFVLGGIVRYLG